MTKTKLTKSEQPKPDNSYTENPADEKTGARKGYLFTAWNIHVAAETLEEAKQFIKDHLGHDVDKETPPPEEKK